MRFREMDLNNDGIISRDEWRGSAQSFRVHDWNRDNMLSGDEVRVSARRPADVDDPDFDPETSNEFWNWTAQGFTSLDRNRDGRITRSEWPYASETFYRTDRNRDNVLSRAEFLGGDNPAEPVDDDRNDQFDYLDVNDNGRIERSEWHGSEETFTWLDRNRNGVLSRAEVVGNAAANAQNTQFASVDSNRNNVITPDEWRWSRRSFDQRDLNRDGRLTRREFNATETTLATPARAEIIRVDPRERWTDTGITVQAGDVITVQADGTITMMTSDANDTATPAGSRTGRTARNAPFPNASAGALIARVDDAPPILIGDRRSVTAPATGRLYLGVNDDYLDDNRGEFRVTISVLSR